MNRFFIPSINASGNKITITDKSQIHHLKDVLRLETGEEVALFDGKGNEVKAEIGQISLAGVCLTVMEKSAARPKKMYLTIACAIPKKSKFDDIIDKLTQLGVDRIIPLKTERCIVKLTKEKEAARHKRWLKISLSATQQSQRSVLPQIDPLTDVRRLIGESTAFRLKLIPTLEGERKTLKEVYAPTSILVLIGPEGDFTAEEINLASKNGFIPVSLGTSVLRVETAAVAVASFINLNENN